MAAPARKRAEAAPAALPPVPPGMAREAGAIGLGLAGVLLAMAVLSFDPVRRTNLIGQAGATLADVLVQLFGLWSIVLPGGLVVAACLVFAGRWQGLGPLRAACLAGAVLAGAVLLQILLGSWRRVPAGGLVGGFLQELLRDGFGTTGALLIAATVFGLCAAIATGRSLLGVAAGLGRGAVGAAGSAWRKTGFRRRPRSRMSAMEMWSGSAARRAIRLRRTGRWGSRPWPVVRPLSSRSRPGSAAGGRRGRAWSRRFIRSADWQAVGEHFSTSTSPRRGGCRGLPALPFPTW